MIYLIPQKFIHRGDLKKWSCYAGNIYSFPYVKKYLQDPLRYWVENTYNPLSIPWILALFEGGFKGELDNLDKTLGELEGELGEDNLKATFKELQDVKTEYSYEVCKKIFSLSEEILVAKDLPKKHIKKIEKNGDWEYDNTIVSVKSILPLEFNCQMIENTIRSLFFIEENNILRNYYRDRIGKCENIDDTFRKDIPSFLESGLELGLINTLNSWNYLSLEPNYFAEKPGKPHHDKNLVIHLKIDTSRYDSPEGKEIKIIIHGTSDKIHHIEMIFKENIEGKNYLYIDYDTDVFWGHPVMKKEYLERGITERIKLFNKNYTATKKEGKNFEGWITILVHPMHENDIKNNQKEMEQFIKGTIGSRNYKIYVVFRPQARFDLKEPVIFYF